MYTIKLKNQKTIITEDLWRKNGGVIAWSEGKIIELSEKNILSIKNEKFEQNICCSAKCS